jgi:BirA family transcriptional regulator, biotin operon repressor / biotin---[acetyl-CoA-carboxylase] ligase
MSKTIIGKEILIFDRLNSTNQKARELMREKTLAEGTIIMAVEQFAGKGYASNSWESSPGENLTVSYILKPEFLPPHHQFWLTKILSLSILDVVKHHAPSTCDAKVKWPNDIYVDDKKIAGILAENSIMGDTIKDSICGIGLNVNQIKFISGAPNPVSLQQLTGIVYDLQAILSEISMRLTYWYEELMKQQFTLIGETYQKSLYRMGMLSHFESNGTTFQGSITGTDPYGRLQIKKESGTTLEFDFKEVSFVL